MSDIDFRQNGKRISGSNGSSGYDEGNRLIIDGNSFYKEGNIRYYCPDDGKIYNTDNGHISTLEDGIIGTYDKYGAHIYGNKSNPNSDNVHRNHSNSSKKVDATTAMGIYYTIELIKKHFIGILIFINILAPIFVKIGTLIGNAYLGFAIGFVISIFIASCIEKLIKSFYQIIKYGHIKGKFFLILGIFALFFLGLSIYSIFEGKGMIADNERHMAQDPSYSIYANERIQTAKDNINDSIQYCLVSSVIAVVSGTIFIVRNQTQKN